MLAISLCLIALLSARRWDTQLLILFDGNMYIPSNNAFWPSNERTVLKSFKKLEYDVWTCSSLEELEDEESSLEGLRCCTSCSPICRRVTCSIMSMGMLILIKILTFSSYSGPYAEWIDSFRTWRSVSRDSFELAASSGLLERHFLQKSCMALRNFLLCTLRKVWTASRLAAMTCCLKMWFLYTRTSSSPIFFQHCSRRRPPQVKERTCRAIFLPAVLCSDLSINWFQADDNHPVEVEEKVKSYNFLFSLISSWW